MLGVGSAPMGGQHSQFISDTDSCVLDTSALMTRVTSDKLREA